MIDLYTLHSHTHLTYCPVAVTTSSNNHSLTASSGETIFNESAKEYPKVDIYKVDLGKQVCCVPMLVSPPKPA